MKRAQAALEFLTTYGWAFFVILVMIGALSYFGVFNISTFAPEFCILDAKIECPIASVQASGTNPGVYLLITNSIAGDITLHNVTLNETRDPSLSVQTNNAATLPGYTTMIEAGEEGEVYFPLPTANALVDEVGEKLKFDVVVRYTRGQSLIIQEGKGSMTVTIQ
jgi:hypothetical protein